jgi:hypothetical protein
MPEPIKFDDVFKLDDVSWHYKDTDHKLPESLREELAGAHIGIFLRWCFVRGFQIQPEDDDSELIDDSERLLVERVARGETPGYEYIRILSDSKLVSDMMSRKIRPFVRKYYHEGFQYVDDYAALFPNLVYQARECDLDFAKLSSVIDGRYDEYLRARGAEFVFRPLTL